MGPIEGWVQPENYTTRSVTSSRVVSRVSSLEKGKRLLEGVRYVVLKSQCSAKTMVERPEEMVPLVELRATVGTSTTRRVVPRRRSRFHRWDLMASDLPCVGCDERVGLRGAGVG